MPRFEELADTPTPDGTAREASKAEPPHDGGRLSTIYERSVESHVKEAWSAELQEERELLVATPPEDLSTIPTHMVSYQSVLIITVADGKRGHLAKWGRTRDSDTEETYYVPMCTMVEDDSYRLDSDENGRLSNSASRQKCQRETCPDNYA
eukprot:3246584-Pyramimonas_sp.AAC.1